MIIVRATTVLKQTTHTVSRGKYTPQHQLLVVNETAQALEFLKEEQN